MTECDYWATFKKLLLYDPDLLNAMYVTPHRWTPFYEENGTRLVVLEDRSKWDYRHQVLSTRHLRPWQVFLAVKAMEAAIHLRPRFLFRLLVYPDNGIRRALRWCVLNSSHVWIDEIDDFVFRTQRTKKTKTLLSLWGQSAAHLISHK